MNNLTDIVQCLDKYSFLEQDVFPGNERMMFNAFYKKFFYFRNSHITNKFKKIPSVIQLPMNSCIHILSNLYNEERGLLNSDLPDLNLPFIKNEVFRKFIYHVKEPNIRDTNNPISFPNQKYIFRNMGLEQNIRKFRAEYGDKIKPLSTLEAIPNIPSTLTIINHNPLFRVQVRELLPQYKRFLIILGSVLNTAAKISNDKTQYIFLPLGNHIYLKDMFRLAEKEIKPTSIKVKTDFHYFLMMHWFNFINPFSDQTILKDYPQEKWDKTIFVFYYGDYYMFWSLSDIVRINERNMVYNRLLNQFNSLVLTGMGASVPDETTESDITDIASDTSVKVDGTPDTEQDKVKQDQIDKERFVENIIKKSTDSIVGLANNLDKLINLDSAISTPDLNYTVIKPSKEKEIIDETTPPEVLTQLVDNLDVTESVEETATIENPTGKFDFLEEVGELSKKVQKKVQKEEQKEVKEEIEERITPYTFISGDLSSITPFTDPKSISDLGSEFIDEIDEVSSRLINKQQNLTSKQKQRLNQIAIAYKNITLGNDSIEKILLDEVDVSVEKNEVNNLDNYLADKSMNKSSIQTFDVDYMSKLYRRHLAQVATSFNKQGMFLVGIDEKVVTDELNRIVTYKLSYEDIKGKRHTVKFTLPLVGEDGTCYVNGTKQYFRTQMTNLPICKVSPVRVSLASSYNKTIVERNTNKAHSFLPYLQRLISKINEKKANSIVLEYGVVKNTDIKLPYEYAEISNIYKSIVVNDIHASNGSKYTFTFDYKERYNTSSFNLTEKLLEFIKITEQKLNAVFIGIKESSLDSILYCFITSNNIIKMIDTNDNIIHSTTFIDMLSSIYNVKLSSRLNEWTDIKILDKKFPVIFLLAYKYGLNYVLKYLGVPYKVISREQRLSSLNLRPTDVVLTFKDNYIVIPRYPLRNSLILSGLSLFTIEEYNLDQFESKDVYYSLLLDKNFKINYLKGIDDTFDLFIDPMTKEVLAQMNEPTNFRDLLIRATDMVSTNYHKEAASMTNFRYRGYERFNSMVYNAMARQYASFSKKKGAGATFSLNPNSVLLSIIQDSAMINAEDINPIHDIKTKTEVTYVGQGGRTSESFVINDRRFPNDGVGVLSEATKDSGNVAIAVQTPMNPIVANLYGFYTYQDKHELDPTQILSVSNLTMPCTTQDDGKRAGFVSHQLSHAMATKEGSCFRIRTGYESIVAHRCSKIYAVSAKQNGTVVEINEKAKLCKVRYDDGTIEVFTYGEEYGQCADIITTQKQELTVKVGDTFNKGEILCYNPQFFEKDLYNRQVFWKHGVPANVAWMEIANNYEDSSTITQEFGKKLEIEPVEVRMITIDKNTFIHMFKHIGDKVDITDELMIFEDADSASIAGYSKDEETLAYLAKLNRSTPKAKVSGTIVDMEMYCGCSYNELHDTLKPIFKEANAKKKARHKFSEDSNQSIYFSDIKPIPKGTKFKGASFEEDTVVIRYFIKEELTAGVGDKIVVDSSLKSVISDVIDEPIKSVSGINVDIVFASTGMSNRIVNSPMLVGIGERILEELEKQVIDIYNS